MRGMLRMLLGAGLVVGGLLLEVAIVPAQESAFISGDQAVRFEQAPGFFHYAALCRTATEFKAQMPPNRLPREMTESAVCWYVVASKTPTVGGTKDTAPTMDGKLILSEHHVRFIPHDGSRADLYMDLHPQEIEMKHEPGQPLASLATREFLFNFRFSKICPTCARGTPVPVGLNPALLEQEFKLVGDTIRNFQSGWVRIYQLSSKIRVEVAAENQPGGSASADDMRFYGNLNLHLAEFCSEPAKSCIGSFATYETCKSLRGGSGCGQAPSCSASCAVSTRDLQNLQARPCVQLDQQGASLLPDWNQLLRQKNPGSIPAKPLQAGVVDIQFTSGSNSSPGVGCSLQASYLRASNAGAGTGNSARAGGSGSTVASAKSGPVAAAKPAGIASAKPSGVSSARPDAPSVARASDPVSPNASSLSSTRANAAPPPKPAAVPPPKPSGVSPAKPGALAAARSTAPVSSNASILSSTRASAATPPKPAAVPPPKPSGVSPAKPGALAAARSTAPVSPNASILSSTSAGAAPTAKSAALPPQKTSDIDSPESSAVPSVKPALVASEQPQTTSLPVAPALPAAHPRREGRNALKIAPEAAVGMLLKKVAPAYPLEAKVARVQGTVVLNATISTTGEVSTVDVVSGPQLLQSAAVDAVKQWQYRPFSFNGQPVEVETTIHVVFGEGSAPVPASAKSHP
jgi:protein TonB